MSIEHAERRGVIFTAYDHKNVNHITHEVLRILSSPKPCVALICWYVTDAGKSTLMSHRAYINDSAWKLLADIHLRADSEMSQNEVMHELIQNALLTQTQIPNGNLPPTILVHEPLPGLKNKLSAFRKIDVDYHENFPPISESLKIFTSLFPEN